MDVHGADDPTSVSAAQGAPDDGSGLDDPASIEAPDDRVSSTADAEPEDLIAALRKELSRDVVDDGLVEQDVAELPDFSKLLARFDYSKIFARFDISKMIGQIVVPRPLPDYSALFARMDVSRLLPDYSQMMPALPDLSKVVLPALPDYSKLIPTLVGRFDTSRLLSDYSALFARMDVSRLLPPQPDYLKAFDDLDVSRLFGAQMGDLATLMSKWSDIVGFAGRYLRAAARSAYAAALEAREAVLGRGDEWVVVDFIRRWLKMGPTRSRVEAVVAALLEPEAEWMSLSPLADSAEVVRVLRRRVNHLHRDFRLITETQVNRQRIVSLEQPWTSRPDGGVVPLSDLVADPRAAEMLPETFWTDERIARVLGGLSTDEYRVAITYTAIDDSSWKAAAERAGLSPAFGERVRRKLQRLGKEFQARQLAQAVVVAVDRTAGFRCASTLGTMDQ